MEKGQTDHDKMNIGASRNIKSFKDVQHSKCDHPYFCLFQISNAGQDMRNMPRCLFNQGLWTVKFI